MNEMQNNKDVVRRIVEEYFNNRAKLDNVDQYIDPNIQDHGIPQGMPNALDGFRNWVQMHLRAFPDGRFNDIQVIGENDMICVLSTFTGTQKGEFCGIAPTNKRVRVYCVDLSRVRNGKVVEHWGGMDAMSLMTQIGVMPVSETVMG